MAQASGIFDWKRQLLIDNIAILMCSKCQSVPGPGEKASQRYSCVKNVHTLCSECKSKCHCGSEVLESPTPLCQALLKNLPWYCKNYSNGCQEIFANEQELVKHQKGCQSRSVPCVFQFQTCEKKVKLCSKMVVLKNWRQHFEESHAGKFTEDDWDIVDKKYFLDLRIKLPSVARSLDYWSPCLLTAPEFGNFVVQLQCGKECLRCWILCLEAPFAAENYAYEIEAKVAKLSVPSLQRTSFVTLIEAESEKAAKFTFEGISCYPDAYKRQVEMGGNYFIMPRSAATKLVELEVLIWNKKEEAKDEDAESGVSDIDDRSESPDSKRLKTDRR